MGGQYGEGVIEVHLSVRHPGVGPTSSRSCARRSRFTNGRLPGYAIRYVDQVRADPSDQPVTMPGRRYLLIVFNVAQAHTEGGEVSVSPKSMTFNYPMLQGYVIVGDFEGYVSMALDLDDVVGFRVGELASPNRIYVDVAA
jgi:hypothetical protein